MTTITAEKARNNLSDIISKARWGNETILITHSGKKAAVLMSHSEYERLLRVEKQLEEIRKEAERQAQKYFGEKEINYIFKDA